MKSQVKFGEMFICDGTVHQHWKNSHRTARYACGVVQVTGCLKRKLSRPDIAQRVRYRLLLAVAALLRGLVWGYITLHIIGT